MLESQVFIDDTIKIIALITGIISLLSPIVIYVYKYIKKYKEERKKIKNDDMMFRQNIINFNDKVEETLLSMEERIKRGEYHDANYLESLKVLDGIIDRNHIQDIKTEKMMQSMLATNRDRLLYLIKSHIKKGNITVAEFENITYLFEAYKDLGGNGAVEDLMQSIRDLNKIVE